VLEFPEPRVGLNGGCLIAPDTLLIAGAANLIWRVDLPKNGGGASARVWLQHDNMKNRPGEKKPEQPGVNGIRYAPHTHHLYYTSTSQQLMMRVRVDPTSLEPAALPEFIAGGRQWDDFIIDEDAGVAYVTTHRDNTIDRVRLEPDGNREGWTVVAGEPFSELLVGPSAHGGVARETTGEWRISPRTVVLPRRQTALSGLRSCCASSYLQRRDTTVSGQQRRGFVTIARSTRRARLAYGRAYWCRRRKDDFGEPTRSFETSSSRFWTAGARSVAVP
jgi:hypothetical protein